MGQLARAAFMHHADPSGVYQPRRFNMMHGCSPDELFAKAAAMYHNDRRHSALKHYAALTWLMGGHSKLKIRNLHYGLLICCHTSQVCLGRAELRAARIWDQTLRCCQAGKLIIDTIIDPPV